MNRPLIVTVGNVISYLFIPSDYYTIWTGKPGDSAPDSVTGEKQSSCLCLCLCSGYRRSGKWWFRTGGRGEEGAVETVYSKPTDPVNGLQHVELQSITLAPKGEAKSVNLHTWPTTL